MSKERDNYKALKMKKAAEKEAAMKKAEEKEIARKKEMENRITKGIEALKYIIKNDEQRFQGILQLYVGAYSHDSNFFVSAFCKAVLFIDYMPYALIPFSNYKLLDLKNFILNGEPGVIERVVAERKVQDFIGSNKELVAGLVKTTNGLSKKQRDSIVDLTNAMLKAIQNRVEYNEFAKIVADGMERDGNRLVMVERLMKFALNKPDLKSAVIKIAQTAQWDIRKALWATSILKNVEKFIREHKDNEMQAFISQVEFIVRGDKNIPNDQKEEMIAYRAFRAICKDHDMQQRFFAALEKEKGISLTREDLLEINKALKEFYPRNSASVFQGLASQIFYFDFNEQNFEMIHSMLYDLNRGNIPAALEKNISMSFDNVEFLKLKGEFDNIVEKAKKLESKPEGEEEVLGVLKEVLHSKQSELENVQEKLTSKLKIQDPLERVFIKDCVNYCRAYIWK